MAPLAFRICLADVTARSDRKTSGLLAHRHPSRWFVGRQSERDDAGGRPAGIYRFSSFSKYHPVSLRLPPLRGRGIFIALIAYLLYVRLPSIGRAKTSLLFSFARFRFVFDSPPLEGCPKGGVVSQRCNNSLQAVKGRRYVSILVNSPATKD